jgi:hypothetical protein
MFVTMCCREIFTMSSIEADANGAIYTIQTWQNVVVESYSRTLLA